MTTNSEKNNKIIVQNNSSKNIENPVQFLCKKKSYFKIEDIEACNLKKTYGNEISNKGRWTNEEHDNFLKGIEIFGTKWKKVKTLIKTRALVQVRSHAQKFYLKMKTCKDDNLGIDFTLDSINNIKDMVDQIKTINNYDIVEIFKKLDLKFFLNKKIKKNKNEQKYDGNNIENINNKLFISQKEKKEKTNKFDDVCVNNLFVEQNKQIKENENFLKTINSNQYINNVNNINYNNLLLNNNINNNNIFINQYNNNDILTNYFNSINNINNINNLFSIRTNILYCPYINNISLFNDLLIPLSEQDIANNHINNNLYYIQYNNSLFNK